jgi:hypothetical protein
MLTLRFVLIIGVNLLAACGSFAFSNPNYVVLEENHLPDELKETSGLYCPEVGSAYTVNDSGNKPIIFNIDPTGLIVDQIVVATNNTDWEALTGDDEHFYIGDVGNNKGTRKFIQIHTVPKQHIKNEDNVTTSKVFYRNNVIKNNEYLNHDFDAETLININNSLFLFSKSWNTGTLFIYQLDKVMPEQLVEAVSEIKGLSGVITGGDFDRKNNRFILVGYELKGMGSFHPFITILNRDLTLHKSFGLSGYGQVEGVCVTPNGEVWFTQEGSFFSDHKIVKLKLTE